MKGLLFLVLLVSCAHKERPLQERQLIQCYMESDTYTQRRPFSATLNINVSELGTVTAARVTETSSKDPNLNSCLSYVMMGTGNHFRDKLKPGPLVKSITFRPDGKHEL